MNTQQKPSKAFNITLGVLQFLLAIMFIMVGLMKLSKPIDQLSQSLPWVSQMPEVFVRFIGASELLGAIGLIMPALLRIKPILTPIAAVGLALVQLFAMIFHISRGETSVIGMNVILLLIAAFIAWGRSKKALIAPKVRLA